MGTIPPAGRLYRFSGLDAAAAGAYVGITVLFAVVGDFLSPLLRQMLPNPASTSFASNLVFYGVVGVVALIAARGVVGRDLRILATRPWFTLLMVPTALVVMVVFSTFVVALTGGAQSTGNQMAVQGLIQQIPAWLVIPLLVLVGPFVEEYLFRHLLIGKLSQHVNIWICCGLSVLVFAAIHVVGREGLVLPALMPYLCMGSVLVAVYVWTGRNVMFSYFVHAAKNLLAVALIYAIPPELLEQVNQLPT